MMNKSDFYKKFRSKDADPGEGLNTQGYPANLEIDGAEITTEEQWQKYLDTELEVAEMAKLDEDAAYIAGIEWVDPYADMRVDEYPLVDYQLDGIYKCLLAIKESGIDLGEGQDYLDTVTAVKNKYPKN